VRRLVAWRAWGHIDRCIESGQPCQRMHYMVQETAGNSPQYMDFMGSEAYNLGSVRSVSRETTCPCGFSVGHRLNGVQEVAGSNPVAPTCRKASRSNQLRLAFFSILGLIPTPGAELREEIRPFRTIRYPSSAA